MRNHSMFQLRLAISSVVLAFATLSPVLQAQAPEVQANAIVPFGFEVGSAHIAAGSVNLRTMQDRLISVRGAGAGSAVMSLTRHEINLEPAPASKLVFHKYGDRYFLAEIWSKNSTVHLCFIPSKAETQAKRSELASNHTSAKNNGVEIALLQNSNR